MKKLILVILFILLAFSAPNSIKTAYNTNDAQRNIDLSLELSQFGDQAVLLEWTSGANKNVVGFQVERLDNGDEYKAVAFIPASIENPAQKYQYVDSPEQSGYLIYRIKKIGSVSGDYIHAAGKFKLKAQNIPQIVQVNKEKDDLQIQFILTQKEDVKVRILSSLYEPVASIFNGQCEKGQYEVTWSPNKKAYSGVYFVEIASSSGRNLQEILF